MNSENPVFGPFLAHFPNVGGKMFFPGNPALSPTTSYGFLAPCQGLEKTNDTISRKCQDRQKDGQKDRQTEGQTLFYRILLANARCPKMQARSKKSYSFRYIKI